VSPSSIFERPLEKFFLQGQCPSHEAGLFAARPFLQEERGDQDVNILDQRPVFERTLRGDAAAISWRAHCFQKDFAILPRVPEAVGDNRDRPGEVVEPPVLRTGKEIALKRVKNPQSLPAAFHASDPSA